MIDRDSPVPLYYQLKLHYKEQIDEGELQPGDRLPTEMELCDRLGISRAPVRQAMTDLAREGLIYRRPGQGSFVAEAAASEQAERTQIRVLAYHDVRWMASLEQAVHTWNDIHSEQQVQLNVELCGRNEFHAVLRRKAIQGDAPDIAAMDFVWLSHYATEGYLAPLNAIDATWAERVSRTLETPVLHVNTFDSELFGVPVQADITGLWYRKDWFEAEGIEPPETWDAWLTVIDHFAQAEVRNQYGYRYPLVLPVTAMTGEPTVNLLMPFIWMAGGEILDDQGSPVIERHSDEICRALRYLQEITVERRDFLPQDVFRSRWWHLARFYARGDVAMALGGSYEWPRIREESEWDSEVEAAENLGFTLLPRPSTDVDPVGSLGGTSWVIFQQSEEQKTAMELLKLIASPAMSETFCADNLQISPYLSVNMRLARADHPWLSQVVPLLGHARHRPRLPNYNQLSSLLQEMFERVLWEGMDPEQALAKTATALSYVIEGSCF
jgi:ABC-type glycerol-3-phosphate transport system substrate-binding protein